MQVAWGVRGVLAGLVMAGLMAAGSAMAAETAADTAASETAPAAAEAAEAAPVVKAAKPRATRCRTRGFIVNDFGKEGPARDAQALLDKDIAAWTKANGIKKYTTGKKTVTCELFLVIPEEWTCTAKARFCW